MREKGREKKNWISTIFNCTNIDTTVDSMNDIDNFLPNIIFFFCMHICYIDTRHTSFIIIFNLVVTAARVR